MATGESIPARLKTSAVGNSGGVPNPHTMVLSMRARGEPEGTPRPSRISGSIANDKSSPLCKATMDIWSVSPCTAWAYGVETKGFEPSTSALRTQGLDDFDAEKYGENDAGDSRCPNGCPSEDASAASKPALNENNIPQQLSWEQLKQQSSMPDPVAAYLQLLNDTQGHPLAQTELDLAFLLTRWPNLPQHIRQTIMMLVRSVEVPANGNTSGSP